VSLFVRPQELVLAYLALAAIGLAAALGWSLISLVAVVVAAAVLCTANLRLASTGISLWRGLCLTAARAPTGWAWVDLVILAPRLVSATLYAVVIAAAGLPFPLAWTRSAWLAALRATFLARLRR
jgi:hypothetical protein